MNQYALLVFILLFSYCSVNYNSTEKQCHFLQTLQGDYEKAFDDAKKAKEQYGYRSKPHNLALRKQHKIVKQSMLKMEEYLTLYGFPTTEDHGPDLVKIPRKILVDKNPSLENLERYLPHFYKGWQNEDFPDWAFVLYLQNIYQYKFGDILRLENPYTEEMQRDSLMKILKIEEELIEVSN